MAIIDNVSQLWGDDLKATLVPGAKLRIAAAAFSIYAYEALKEELEQVESVEFIFSTPTFVPEENTDRIKKHQRRYYIPQIPPGESALYGTEFEIRLRNKLTQKAIARECADWIRRKATFKSNRTDRSMQSVAVVGDQVSYRSFGGFTASDLGYEQGNAFFNTVDKHDDADVARQYLQQFDQLWDSRDHLTDVTQRVRDHIDTVYQENSPAHVYFLILYNIFKEFLEDITEDNLPKEGTKYQETKVWQSLYDFQRDAATGIINKLETFNGCILADSVGLGKTFTALAVIKYYERRNMKVLVLAPKKLSQNWLQYKGNLKGNIFVEDGFNFDVLAHTDLSRTKGESLGIRLEQVNWSNYDLVVIDESHNFRNADYAQEKESRYQRLMREVIREGISTRVLMLSATPVNNRFTDLKNQLQLAYEGDAAEFETQLNIGTSVEKIFRDAQSAFNDWSKLDLEDRTTDRILKMLNFDFFKLLDAVTIARSRKHIQAYYDMSKIGAFPQRRQPLSVQKPLTDLESVPSYDEIFQQIQELNLGVYAPLDYVFPSRRKKYEDQYAVPGESIGQSGREQGLKKLMTVNLLKRLESSVEAFRKTVSRIESVTGAQLERLEQRDTKLAAADFSSEGLGADEDDAAEIDAILQGENIRIDLNDVDTEKWRRDLWHDRETLRELLSEMEKVTPLHDLKLQSLKSLIRSKAQEPINPGNRKVLIFSAFADTAEYLYRELAEDLRRAGLESALITGGSSSSKTTVGTGYDFQEVLTLFSPRSKGRADNLPAQEIDVVIATDVISEGQNLQDCDYLVNYDIHWNPVRIIQRFGRIDRIGSKNAQIQLVNFWPDISLDEYINLKDRVEGRMVIANVAGTGDDNVLDARAREASYRKEQLQKLRDEVPDFEDVRTGVSITDLGLNDFRTDLISYVERHGTLEGSPKGLHAVVPAKPEVGLRPGVLFALKNLKADQSLHRNNLLHPYYLVYLDDQGQVIADHTQVKHLLDLIRSGARDLTAPVTEVCSVFNAATQDGAEMSHYSQLLDDAIRSMIDVTQEQDVESLFTAGGTTALHQSIEGLDDFELIAFLAIVDSSGGENS